MSAKLSPWFGVATPHEDIREGRLSEAVFAANLWRVWRNEAHDVYQRPEMFFAKTYLTAGLTNVLKRVGQALSRQADAGDRILNLQTSFGGAKTHTLVACWHLAKHPDVIRRAADCAEVREKLGSSLPSRDTRVAVFTNQSCNATQGRETPEGIHTRTLWGELALQLGGVELYRKIEPNDQRRTNPQGLFTDILKAAAPCLILIDELADYCVSASGEEVGTTTLADQTISFVQELTDAVTAVPGVALVATLPASHMEVASPEKGQEILDRLERRFGRMSADIKPVADDEIYEVVRRRLFETLGDPDDHQQVAEAYFKMYQAHKNEVPAEATRGTFKDRIVATYPFHPSLIDAMYLRWGSHGDFQRTRGVLRLLASVVGDLWDRRNTETQSQLLIQPCHVRWTIDAMHAALTRLWGDPYGSVVAADVIGNKANAAVLDEERGGEYGSEKIAQGLAAAVLLGSFGGAGERAGYSTKDLKICVGRPGLNWGYSDGALMGLEECGFYLHTASAGNQGKRYWFGTKPTLTKLLVQYRTQFASQQYDDEIIETLKDHAKGIKGGTPTWHVLVDPQPDLPEQKSLTVLIMPPACACSDNGGSSKLAAPVEARIRQLSEKCGTKDRRYRNTLLFLLTSVRGLSSLRATWREVAALQAVKHDYGSQLDPEQKEELDDKLKDANAKVITSIGSALIRIARFEGQAIVDGTLTDAGATLAEHLDKLWTELVEGDTEWVVRKVGPVEMQNAGLVPSEGGIRVKDAVEAFLRYTDKPMIASPAAVVQGLVQACEDKLIGIGRGTSVSNLQRKWCGQRIDIDPTEDGVWIIPPFEPESKPEPRPDVAYPDQRPSEGQDVTESHGTGVQRPGGKPPDATTAKPASKRITRITIQGNVPMESWADVFGSFVGPSTRMNLKRRLGIDFELATQGDTALDENDATVKAMTESARQLGLEIDFE